MPASPSPARGRGGGIAPHDRLDHINSFFTEPSAVVWCAADGMLSAKRY